MHFLPLSFFSISFVYLIIRGNANEHAIRNIWQLQKYSAPEGTRTLGPQIKSLMLYRLSYRGGSLSSGHMDAMDLWIALSILCSPVVFSQTA